MFCAVSPSRHYPQEIEKTKYRSKDQQTVATVYAACPCQHLQIHAFIDQCAGQGDQLNSQILTFTLTRRMMQMKVATPARSTPWALPSPPTSPRATKGITKAASPCHNASSIRQQKRITTSPCRSESVSVYSWGFCSTLIGLRSCK